MWSVTKKKDMWLKKPVKLQSSYKKKDELKYVSEDNNCQSTKIYRKSMCSDKNCQENINMLLVKPQMDVQLPKPAVPYEYKRLCNDRNCQSTRYYKKRNYDKNCQSDNNMCYNK